MIDLYNMDCMEAMKKMKDNEFDLAIVDPPYGIDLANMNMGAGNKAKHCNKKRRGFVAKKWDNETPKQNI
jgi:site-specific DNA-methyltransferase (adenine-specific)